MARSIIPDFHLCENTEPLMVVSRDVDRAERFAKEVSVPRWGSLTDALRADDIDAVYVATPHPFHAATAVAALEAGKHVLVEKPLTMNVAEAKRVVATARANQRFLMEALWQAFNPTVVELRRRVASGVLGDLAFAQASFGFHLEVDPVSRMWARELGGGSVLDQAVYPLSLVQSLFGEPSRILATGSIGPTGVDNEAIAILEFPNGTRATATSTLRAQLSNTAEVAGSLGRIEVQAPIFNPRGLTQYTWAPGDSWAAPEVESFSHEQEGNGYVPMLRAVSQAISAGELEHPFRTHEASLQVMQTMEEILRQLGIVWE